MLDVPKSKMNRVMHQLLRGDDAEFDDELVDCAVSSENPHLKLCESRSSNKFEHWRDGSAEMPCGGSDESEKSSR